MSASSWFKNLIIAPNFDAEFFGVLGYFLWFYRNKMLFEGASVDSFSLISKATHLLSDFRCANGWPERPNSKLLSRSWARPPENGFCFYFDGSVSKDGACAGVGVFVADENVSFVFGVSKAFQGIQSPQLAEMLAFREAILLARSLRLGPIPFVGDSQEVICAILGEGSCLSICLPILEEIQDLLSSTPCLGFFWVRRSLNLVAHELAFHAKSIPFCNATWSSVPDFLLSSSAG